jgi:hypothetical protein
MDAALDRVSRDYGWVTLNRRFDDPAHEFFYPRTDAAPYLERGIPYVEFFTGLHGDYHAPGDEVSKFDPTKFEAVARTIYATCGPSPTTPCGPASTARCPTRSRSSCRDDGAVLRGRPGVPAGRRRRVARRAGDHVVARGGEPAGCEGRVIHGLHGSRGFALTSGAKGEAVHAA